METVVLFQGQGAQRVGMVRESNVKGTFAEEIFQTANQILGYDLLQLCENGPAQKLDNTLYSQPAIFVCSWISFLNAKSLHPELFQGQTYFAGLSLGEYGALVAAGVLDFESGLRLVRARAEAMENAAKLNHGGMTTCVGLDIPELQLVCDEWNAQHRSHDDTLIIANQLFPKGNVLSGDTEAIEWAEATIRGKYQGKARTIRVKVSGAFHSQHMDPARESLKTALNSLHPSFDESQSNTLLQPKPQVFSNVTGNLYHSLHWNAVKQGLLDQLVSPVLWTDTMKTIDSMRTDAKENNTSNFRVVELGPGTQLSAMAKRVSPELVESIIHVGTELKSSNAREPLSRVRLSPSQQLDPHVRISQFTGPAQEKPNQVDPKKSTFSGKQELKTKALFGRQPSFSSLRSSLDGLALES